MDISAYFPIWNKLNTAEQHLLSESAAERHFKKGDLIRTGGDCMGLILVTSGQLRVYTVSEDGREITLYRLFERDMCLFSASCMMRSVQFDISILMKECGTQSLRVLRFTARKGLSLHSSQALKSNGR